MIFYKLLTAKLKKKYLHYIFKKLKNFYFLIFKEVKFKLRILQSFNFRILD